MTVVLIPSSRVIDWRPQVWAAACLAALLAVAPAVAEAQQPTFERVWVDANAGVAVAAQDVFAMTAPIERFDEPGELSVRYTLPRAASFDVGAGVMLTRRWGIGASFDGTMHEHAGELRAQLPHPLFANVPAEDLAETDPVMQRIERSVGLHAMVVVARTRRLRFRAFGGPSRFRVEQDAVDAITYNHIYFVRQPTNFVQLTGFDYTRVKGSGWGGHVGADASFFLTRILGAGVFTKYERGRVTVDNPLSTGVGFPARVTLTAGGLQVGAGLRLKF